VGEEFKSAARSYQDSWNRSADPLVGLFRGFAETAAGAGSQLFAGVFGRREPGGSAGSSGTGNGGTDSGGTDEGDES